MHSPARLIHRDPEAWETHLDGVARDIYQTAGFHEYARGSGEGEPHLVVVRDGDRGFAWPYLLRRVDEVDGLEGSDATDVTSVYGYPGPLAWGCEPGDPFITGAWDAVLDVWRGQRVVSAFTRFNPVLGNATFLDQLRVPDTALGHPTFEAPAATPTVSIDCTLSDAEAAEGYARVLRQEIAAARRAGLITSHDTGWTDIDEFVRLYRETMERSGAAASYYLDSADVERLRRALGDGIHLLVTRHAGGIAAAGLFTEFGGIVQAHLVGTAYELRSLSPLKLLLDDARHWGHERGDEVLHLGGGRGGENDSLFAFKARFSSRRHAFHTGRWIIDPGGYEALVSARGALTDGPAGIDPAYFPGYRTPVGPVGEG